MANTGNVPIDKLYSREETANYCRIILLMVDVGTETLRHLFYLRVPKHTVMDYFASKKLEIEEGKRKKVFDKCQYDKLTCSDLNPDEFDISLLIKLLTYFNLSPMKLDNLQTLRNETVGHKHRAELITQEFQSLWVKVESILLKIARCVSVDEEQITKLKITELKEKVLDVSDRENKIIKIFETWCQEEIAVLREDIQSLQDKVGESQYPANRHYTPNDKSMCGTDDKIVLMLQQDLIIYYRKELSKLQLSPLFEEEGYAADFFDFYVKPNITILSHQRSKGPTPVTFHDIFNCKPYQNIYISSPAGCGKTAFAKYLALIWCQAHLPVKSNNNSFIEEDNSSIEEDNSSIEEDNSSIEEDNSSIEEDKCIIEEDNSSIEEDIMEMQTFMFLFFVFLRDEHERECDVDIMIQNQLLPKLANSTTYTELGLNFIQNLLRDLKCIIILDGLDEWSHPENECTLHNKQMPYIRARPLCTTVTTSRPWKLDVVRVKPGDIDQKLQINGLKDVLLQRLIRNVVKILNELRRKEMQAYKVMNADDFEQELRNKKLTDLSKVPVVVMQLMTVWFDNEPLGESQCEIYSNMIEFLLKRYCKKREIVAEIEDIEVDDCSRDRQIPMCLQNNMYCKVHMELLSKLATLAHNTLFTDNEETSLVFDRRIAKKYLTDSEIEMSLAVGILTQEKVLGKVAIRRSHISFIHKTFQEYLAALYVALSPGTVTNLEEKLKRVCCSIEKVLKMSQIFMFLYGLCPEIMVNLHEHLRQTVSEDSGTQIYRASCELDLWSNEGQTLERVQDTMEEWLGECWLNGHKHVTHLPVSDFFIWSPAPWSAKLKTLTVHNPVSSVYVFGDYCQEDILNCISVFKCIQKLWMWWVSDTFVVQLVSQHKHSLSVRPESWKHLECVTLEWLEMSGDILCSLVDSILQLPKSVKVRLSYCSIIEGTRDSKAYIRSHLWLTVDVDEDVDEDDRSFETLLQFHTNVKLLQFHTHKV